MKLNCEVIRDVLPMYADDLVSASTRKKVEEHLTECQTCRTALDMLKGQEAAPITKLKSPVRRIERNVKHRIWLPILTAVLLILTLICGFFVYCTVPVWLTYEDAIVSIEPDTSMPRIETTDKALSYVSVHGFSDANKTTQGIVFYGYRSNLIYPARKNNVTYLSGYHGEGSVWYRGDCVGQEDVLLLGNGEDLLQPAITEAQKLYRDPIQNKTLIYVFHATMWLGLAFLLLGIILHKKRLWRWLLNAAVFLLCCSVACIFVTDGKLQCFTVANHPWGYMRRYVAILIMTLMSWATVMCGVKTSRVFLSRK